MPERDPAYPIVTAILRVVPASRWAFARLSPDGELAGLLLDSRGNGGELSRLKNEFQRQRAKAKIGPRIAATLGPLGDFESGITLLFADAHASFGILTLLRTSELGPFTSSEISVLALSLDATSERLSALRLDTRQKGANRSRRRRSQPMTRTPAAEPSEEAFYVLDRDLQIVLAWTAEEQRRVALTGLRTRIADRLPAVLEEAVRDLIAGWQSESGSQTSGVAHPVPFLVVRTQPMSGPAGLFIGVRIDRFKPSKLAERPRRALPYLAARARSARPIARRREARGDRRNAEYRPLDRPASRQEHGRKDRKPEPHRAHRARARVGAHVGGAGGLVAAKGGLPARQDRAFSHIAHLPFAIH